MTHDNRRQFLKTFAGTLAGGSALSIFPQLQLVGSAAAQERGTGPYRALVCVYLGGGNDAFNWLIPTDTTRYGNYNTVRGGVYTGTNGPLGLADTALLPTNFTGLPAGQTYGLHPACADWTAVDRNGVQTPNMPGLKTLTEQGKVAWIVNTGSLIVPVNSSNFLLPTTPKPPQLYSHNDQTNVWFQGQSTANFRYGWAGQVADLLFSQNDPIGTSGQVLPMNISFAGANRMQVGYQVVPYQMSGCGNPNGGNVISGVGVGSSFAGCSGTTSLSSFRACATAGLNASEAALCSLLTAPQSHPMSAEHATMMKRSMDLSQELATRLASVAASNPSLLSTPFRALADDVAITGVNVAADGGNGLAEQLAMVARMIKIQAALGQQRNIFFVSLGGFDTHATQMADAGQPRLYRRVSRALGAFYKALEELNMQNNVTTFTVSEFGRTLNSNGDGSDHAWGSISMVMGGSVNGGRIYGTYPQLALRNSGAPLISPDVVPNGNRGQMMPTTSADSISATLAAWMGVSQTNLNTIFPHLTNPAFTGTPFNLGFMNPAP
jgi:uncharacterized protein (DUF1501 family)